jgi:hypothetical protein
VARGKDFQAAQTGFRSRRGGVDVANGRRSESGPDDKEMTDSRDDQDGAPLGLVRRNPITAVMSGFGLGLGFGLAVTLLITRREPSWYERNISEPLHHLPERLSRVPSSVGSLVQSSWR